MNAQEHKWMEEQLELRRQELLVRMCAMEEEYQIKILESLANPKISFGFEVVFHFEKT